VVASSRRSFFPRGGSAQVARALCRAWPTIGWEVSLAAGSLGSAGEQDHAPSFFAGVDVDFPSRTTARARRLGRQQRPRRSRGQPSPERAYTRNEGHGRRRASRTHTVEPLEDPVPRRPDGSAGLRRADRRLARLVRVEAAVALRLCSIVYHTLWPRRQELVASCRSSDYRLKPELPAKHTAPEAACRCGIYACESAAGATPFLSCSRTPARQTLGLVLGRFSLWARWSSANALARRARLAGQHLRSSAQRARALPARLQPGAETVALALGSYGVPIESVACESVAELARRLGREHVQA
jgi:hypothetical protein